MLRCCLLISIVATVVFSFNPNKCQISTPWTIKPPNNLLLEKIYKTRRGICPTRKHMTISSSSEGPAKKTKPQDLFKKYGIAYLLTSITLAIISYALCFFLVSTGVDVSSLLAKVGIKATSTAANAGTVGIAYALHKAASPIRFPPTVVLTPIVASWIGRSPKDVSSQ